MIEKNYYVYVYIDPRNYEEFYYGKGKGSRKEIPHHLNLKRVKEIEKLGKEPIVRVIAANLTENEAFLVEATLLWKRGKWLDNTLSGHYKEHFRPWDTMAEPLPKFDFQNDVYYYNVGECEYRNWDDYIKYNFISAGQGLIWRKAMLGFSPGDIFFAYLKRHGYVGVGIILKSAKMIREVEINNKPLLDLKLKCNMAENSNNKELSEYVAPVKWIKYLLRDQAIWSTNPKLYAAELARTTLSRQPETIKYLENKFKIKVENYLT